MSRRSKAQCIRIVTVLMTIALVGTARAETGYEAGRGLITLEGPSGMFINPTSATLPENAATLQYCVFFPENRTDVVGHGLMGAYGVTDELEIGGIGNYVDRNSASGLSAGGPIVRYRLLKDEEMVPQLSIGGYSRFGDDELDKYAVFVAAYKRVPVQEDGFIRSIGFHGGIRNLWVDDDVNPDDTTLAGYGGGEIQMPLRVYAVGEVTTKDSDFNAHVPYAFGLQWRAPGVAMSAAGIQNGNTSDISFYYGIGLSGSF